MNREIPNTALAKERARAGQQLRGVDFSRQERGACTVERLVVASDEGAKALGRERGRYVSIHSERADLLSRTQKEELCQEVCGQLYALCAPYLGRGPVVAVGLGNRRLTPDALGPLCIEQVRPTRHIRMQSPTLFEKLGIGELVCVLPGVTSERGLDSHELLLSLVGTLSPSLFVVVDAIMTSDFDRLGKSIQLSDGGILPGGGVGCDGVGLCQKTLGVPVVSIGLATVYDGGGLKEKESGRSLPDGMLLAPSAIDGIVEAGAEIIAEAINRTLGIDAILGSD